MLTCLFVGKRPRAELFVPVSHEHRIKGKPTGGLWTCPDDAAARSAWRAWDHAERMGFTRYLRTWRLTASSDARVYTIDAYADLVRAIERWPHDPYEMLDGLAGRSLSIDFLTMSESYDAVHLTQRGEWATRLSYPLDLYGWDCASIFWLRWCFTRVEAAPRRRRTEAASCPLPTP